MGGGEMLKIVRGARLDLLLDAMLGDMVAQPLPPPVSEIVVIQGRGLDRWMSQQAALRFGCWGFVEALFPRQFLLRAFAAVLDGDAPPWSVDDGLLRLELEFRVAKLLPERLNDPRFGRVAAALLGDGASPLEVRDAALRLAPRVTDVLDRAAQHRVDRVRGWHQGRLEADAAPDEPWLAELSREIAAAAPPSRLISDRARFLQACAAGGGVPAGLPSRLAVFGVSTIAPAFFELLSALSRRVEITVYALDPSPASPRHALIEAWGIESIEFSRAVEVAVRAGAAGVREIEPVECAEGRSSLLARVQALLRSPDEVEGAAGMTKSTSAVAGSKPSDPGASAPTDASLRLIACHGALHEVEVVHDSIIGLLASDPALEPQDIAILTPKIGEYGPMVEAVFNARRGDDGRVQLPFTVADRDRTGGSAIDALARALELALSRCERSAVLEVIALEPIAAALGLSPGDLDLLRAWSEASAVRWGIDASHRAHHGRPGEEIGTWRWGLDRLLLGAVMPDGAEGVLGSEEPCAIQAAVEGGDVEVLSRLDTFLAALHPLACAGAQQRPLVDEVAGDPEATATPSVTASEGSPASDGDERTLSWLDEVERLAQAILPAPGGGPFDASVMQLRSKLSALRDAARRAGFAGPSQAIGVRSALHCMLGVLRDEHPGRGLLASGVTVAALQPMRSIPFRVIAIVGMAEGAIPRRLSPPSFDIVAARRQPGDRDARLDDRQVMIETVMAASQALLLTWPGVEPTTGVALPPSVLISELIDAIPELSVERPALPNRGVAPGRRGSARPNAERARSIGPSSVTPDQPLPLNESLDNLENFWKSPTRAFLRGLGVRFDFEAAEQPEEDPIGEEHAPTLLNMMLPLGSGGAIVTERDLPPLLMQGHGLLPRGVAGVRVMDLVQIFRADWVIAADRIVADAGAPGSLVASLDRAAVEVQLDWPEECEAIRALVGGDPPLRVRGAVPALRGVGPLLVTADKLDKPWVMLPAWLRLLAMAASGTTPEADRRGALIIQRKFGQVAAGDPMKLEARFIHAPSPADAEILLARFAAWSILGARVPLRAHLALMDSYAHHCEKKPPADPPDVALRRCISEFEETRRAPHEAPLRALFNREEFFASRGLPTEPSFQELAESLVRPMVRAFKDGMTAGRLSKLAKPAPSTPPRKARK
ncbi:MAG: exodeoxyribonuclease V subunit gamma [Phycisphaeraceae bacterium]|nr:exodeoxyribonuclease V subunit gamma [Phycisphaeraceae bacterium]